MKNLGPLVAAAICACLIAGATTASATAPVAGAAKVTKFKTVITLKGEYANGSRAGGRVRGANDGGICRGPRPIKIFDVTRKNNHQRVDLVNSSDGGSYYVKAEFESGRKYQAVAPKYKVSKTLFGKALCKRGISKTLKVK